MKCRLVVLTYNPGEIWDKWIDAVKNQDLKNISCLVIDSNSSDNSVIKSKNAGFKVIKIPKKEFSHGGTRNYALNLSKDFDILIYMTQDAILYEKGSLRKIISSFKDPNVAISYGRQIPRLDSVPIEAHARIYNYPSSSRILSFEDRKKIGFKVTFNSNSFSAYKRQALEEVGGFPENVSFGEDAYVAGKLLIGGWKISYNAESKVYHSHNYNLFEEYTRYREIGRFHKNNRWLINKFGKPESEGLKYIISEVRYLFNIKKIYIPLAFIKTIFKYIGYKIGWLF